MERERLTAAALAGLGSLSRRRLLDLLVHQSAVDVFNQLRSDGVPHSSSLLPSPLLERLRAQARAVDLGDLERQLIEHDIGVLTVTADGYPLALSTDAERPGVLFHVGDMSALERRRVGVIGTRNATAAGRATAEELGAGLASSGVTVVSGLALGVDAAAHRGSLTAGPGRSLAVVGNGLDSCYPRHNQALWQRMRADQLMLSEWPPGTPPDAFRFPLRNRIIAMLSEVVVVVESRERGGSLITARACLERGVEVMVVPGSPKSRASAGTNLLLRDGATPVTGVADVLDGLGSGVRHLPIACAAVPGEGVRAEVLHRCAEGPVTLDTLVDDCGLSVAEVAMAVSDLIASGHLCERNGWVESAGSRLVHPVAP